MMTESAKKLVTALLNACREADTELVTEDLRCLCLAIAIIARRAGITSDETQDASAKTTAKAFAALTKETVQ